MDVRNKLVIGVTLLTTILVGCGDTDSSSDVGDDGASTNTLTYNIKPVYAPAVGTSQSFDLSGTDNE